MTNDQTPNDQARADRSPSVIAHWCSALHFSLSRNFRLSREPPLLSDCHRDPIRHVCYGPAFDPAARTHFSLLGNALHVLSIAPDLGVGHALANCRGGFYVRPALTLVD